MNDRLRQANVLLLLGSAGLLGGALAFQYLGGLAPCDMCLWQRWPHLTAILLGLLAWAVPRQRAQLLIAGALAVLVSAALGAFHAGVERHWWEGPATCSAAPATGTSSEILGQVLATPLVRCDAIPWELFGISLAGYNALLSAILGGTVLWLTWRRA